jgi:hypothetical protein
MVFVLQGLIVLFAGAMSPAVASWVARGLRMVRRRRVPAATPEGARG